MVGSVHMPGKDFKTYDEQIDLLISRGLNIPDRGQARDFLQRNNYYRISGYSLTLRENDVFFDGVSLQDIIVIYEFDAGLRNILLKYLEIVEVTIKSIYAYEFAHLFGPTGYLDPANFTNDGEHQRLIIKVDHAKEKRVKYEAYLKHFVNDLHQELPIWAYVDLFTFSDISCFYSISSADLKETIADRCDIKKSKVLEHCLRRLTTIRNLCAHGGRLYNRLFEQKPWLSKSRKSLLRQRSDGNPDNAHLYGFIIILGQLLRREDFDRMKDEIYSLTNTYPSIDMRYYGFREDWKEKL